MNVRTATLTVPLTVRAADAATREFTAIGVPFGAIYDMGFGYRERFERGSVDASEAVLAYQHRTPIGTITSARDTAEGLEITARISQTPTGDEVYTLLRDGVLRSMSIGFELLEAREEIEDGEPITTITSARAVEFSVVLNPAYKDAKITDVRAAQTPTEGTPMPNATDATETIEELRAHIDDLDRRVALAAQPAPATVADTRSVGEFVKALASGDEQAREAIAPLMRRDYAGGKTADDGLTAGHPQFMKDLTRIIEEANPLARHFSTGSLPAEGMTLEFLELKDNTVKVAEQKKEGDALPTGNVSTKVRTADIHTWGGASSMSFQEIQRTRTNMVDLTVKAMAAAAGKTAAAFFHSSYETQTKASTASITISKAIDALTYPDLLAMLVDANSMFQELGAPITGLIVDRATFLKIGALETSSGVPYMAITGHGTGTIGTLSADVLSGQLGNVTVIPDLKATSARGEKVAGTFFNADAIRVYTSGLAHLQDDAILTLTRDMSVYYYSAIAVERPDLLVPLKIGA